MKPLFLLSALLATPVFALQGKIDSEGDWAYACDNTGTCRIAGYQAEPEAGADGYPNPVSVLFTRAAGADAAVTGEVALLTANEKDVLPERVTLHINGKAQGDIALNTMANKDNSEGAFSDGRGQLSEAQSKALLAALLDDKADIRLTADKLSWQLSAVGAGTALLGADSFQQRTGKPSALASPGKNDGEVLQPQAKPVIKQAAVSQDAPKILHSDEKEYASLLTLLTQADKTYSDNAPQADEIYTCELFDKDHSFAGQLDKDTTAIALYPLDANNVLAVTLCSLGAYNADMAYAWLSPDLQSVNGYTRIAGYGDVDYRENPSYQNGVIQGFAAMRGIGDCLWRGEWVWDGKAFVQASSMDTGLCRGFPGGAWDLPVLLSDVEKP